MLVGGGVLDAPAGGEGGAEHQPAAVLAVGVGVRALAGVLERELAFGIPVGDLDPYAVPGAQAQDLGLGAGVDHGVGDELAGEDHGVVDDVREAPALQGVADERSGRGDRAPEGVEAGSRPSRDHESPSTRLDIGCQVTYLRGRLGAVVRGFHPQGAAGVRWCRSVMAGFGQGETLGRIG